MKNILLYVFIIFGFSISAQNSTQKQDFRDSFVGTYQRINNPCIGPGPQDYIVTKHPTALDSLYIIDGMMQHPSPDPWLWRIKINSDSTWFGMSYYFGDFKRTDTILVFYGPVVCGVMETIYAKKIISYVDNQNINNQIQIYPNPATNLINVLLSGNTSKAMVTLFNLQGIKIKIGAINGEQGVIDVTNLPPGMYLLKAESEQGVVTKKIIIQH